MALENHPMWRRPRHHLDHDEHVHDHVHWVELFYDLIHVVIIFLLGNFLTDHLDVNGFLIFAGLFIVVWSAWADSGLYNSLYVATDVWHRLIMSAQIVTAMFMAAAVPSIYDHGLTWFMLAYAANRAITALMYWRAMRVEKDVNPVGSLARALARNFALLSAVFAVSAFLPNPINVIVFTSAVAFLHIQWMVPKIGLVHMERAVPRLGHLNERFALLMLIVLGEGFFKLVVTLTEKGIENAKFDHLVNFGFGGFAIFVLAWIYWDFVGNGKMRNTEPRTMVLNWLGHLFIMLAGVAIGVALAGEVKVGFWEPYKTAYAALGCFGLAAYILLLGLLQDLSEDRVADRFARWDVKIFGAVLAIATFFIVPYVPSLVGNLLWGTALFSQIIVPLVRARQTLMHE